MASTTLVESDIADGAALVRQLDKDQFPVTAALWLYESEREAWRLIIASRIVAAEGAREAYRRLFKSMKRVRKTRDRPFGLDSTRIQLVEDSDPLPTLLKRAVKTGPGVSGIRFTLNVVGGRYIDDAYIYRVA